VKPGRIGVLIGAAIAIAAAVEPGVSRVCRVSRNAGVAWSEEVTQEVTFVSGSELNRAFKTSDFDRTATYAVLQISSAEVAVLRLDDGYAARGLKFSPVDFRQLFAAAESAPFIQLNSRDRQEWRIRARSGRRFFDSRER
jgi:hypothetical protein